MVHLDVPQSRIELLASLLPILWELGSIPYLDSPLQRGSNSYMLEERWCVSDHLTTNGESLTPAQRIHGCLLLVDAQIRDDGRWIPTPE